MQVIYQPYNPESLGFSFFLFQLSSLAYPLAYPVVKHGRFKLKSCYSCIMNPPLRYSKALTLLYLDIGLRHS